MWKQPQKLININNFAKFSKLFYEKQKKILDDMNLLIYLKICNYYKIVRMQKFIDLIKILKNVTTTRKK